MSNRSRRQFLEDSLLAAASAAVASSVAAGPGPLYAEDKVKGPNERLRVAVLGVRGRGGSHLGGFRRGESEVVAIVDPDEAIGQTRGVESVEKSTGRKPAFYRDLRRVMDDPEIDVISIATPNHWHALASIWAVQAGKDVYVEKPVS
ncbi:MAG: Gfo/Idh/MocA family oxidoreductase, partial [Planctomycetaceae bacterium]|nr:Gfo/Idh/MocA family oxidoreductase [Planctomycetaceae bacterium]